MVDFPASYVSLQECNHGSVEKTITTKSKERKLILEKFPLNSDAGRKSSF